MENSRIYKGQRVDEKRVRGLKHRKLKCFHVTVAFDRKGVLKIRYFPKFFLNLFFRPSLIIFLVFFFSLRFIVYGLFILKKFLQYNGENFSDFFSRVVSYNTF